MTARRLEVRDLSVRFGSVGALHAVSLEVSPGSVVGLIGPNGAGKTTLLDAVSGLVEVTGGSIALDAVRVDRLAPHRRARLGLARTFQSLELFDDLTPAENVAVATHSRFRGNSDRIPAAISSKLQVGVLSHGERAGLALDRALAGRPKVLLADEPAAGLDIAGRAALAVRLRRLADEEGLGVLVVDHDVEFVLGLCDQVTVLDLGRVIAQGPPAAVRDDAAVVAAYLGGPPPLARAGAQDGRSGDHLAPQFGRALVVEGMSAGYGGLPVVCDVDLTVAAGEVVALLGANGAGKTTTLRAVTGSLSVTGGRVSVLGEPVDRLDRLARRGTAYVAQGRPVFPTLTVGEHLRLAGGRAPVGSGDALFPALADLADRPAGLLSGGEQQMLALACALAGPPHRLLVVDEMSFGLAPLLVSDLLATLGRLADEGVAVLVVEQHAHLALSVADRAYVLRAGRVVLEAPAFTLARQPERLAAAYLGDGSAGMTPRRPA